jgi:phosphoesterase RecJ-like protein
MIPNQREQFNRVQKEITSALTVSIYTHVNPDCDTLSCALALYNSLTKLGKQVDVYCVDPVPETLKILSGADVVKLPEKKVHDLSIAVDCDGLDRIGNAMRSYLSSKSKIAIDHHKTHTKFADVTILDTAVSSCAEIMFQLLKHLGLMSKEVAELLFAGIVTDSGCFQFSSVSKETHQVAGELMSYGFDAEAIIYNVFKKTSINKFMLENRVLSKCKFYENNQIAIITFTQDDFKSTSTSMNDTLGTIVSVIDIDSVKIAYAVAEAANRSYKIMIRSKNGVDSSDIAREFGGGGHQRAAGCRLNGYYEDIIDKLLKVARDRL